MKALVHIAIIFIFIFLTFNSFAQSEKKLLKQGNELYHDKKYSDAEINYRKALEKGKEGITGNFNLGDALYKQGNYEQAATQFQQITSSNSDPQTVSKAYHNLGNALLKSKKFQESVQAYKQSLKINPKDTETKYNLAYAQSMLKQQQQQNKEDKDKKDNKDNKDNKDKQNKDNKDKDKQDEKEKKNDEQKGEEKDKKSEQDKQEDDKNAKNGKKRKPQQLSPEDAQRILEALNQQEKDLQQKLSKKESRRVEVEKNW